MNLTTTITNVSPTRGGTGGGTLLTINGTNLLQALHVSIAGVPCTIQTQSETAITCMTGSFCGSSITALVRVDLGEHGLAFGSYSFQYVDLWSSLWTWGGLPPPEEGMIALIDGGRTILFRWSYTHSESASH